MLDDEKFLIKQDTSSFLKGVQALDQSLTVFYQKALVLSDFELSPGWLILPQNWTARLAAQLWRQSTASSQALIVDDNRALQTQNLRSSIIVLGHPQEETRELIDKRLDNSNSLVLIGPKHQASSIQRVDRLEFEPQNHFLLDIYFYYQALSYLSAGKDFKADFSYLQNLSVTWGSNSPSSCNLAKQLAYDVLGQTVVILVSQDYSFLAEKWQMTLQKINQQLVWSMIYAEDNDSPFVAWKKQLFDKNYCLLNLAVSLDSQTDFYQEQCRRLSGLMPKPLEVKIKSQNMLEEYLSFCLLSDYLAFYLAVLNNNTASLKA